MLCECVSTRSGAIFDYDNRKDRLAEIHAELENPQVWSNHARAQELGREKSRIESILSPLEDATRTLDENAELLSLAEAEDDAAVTADVEKELDRLDRLAADLEFRRMFSGEMDA